MCLTFMVLSVHLNQFRKIFYLTVLALGFFGAATFAHAAEINFSPSTGSYAIGQSFTVTVQVDPQGKSVNAVEAKLSFDNTKLSVVSVSKTGSVFSLWTTEPTFSNSAGTIDFGGGSPTPFTARSTLIAVTFKTLAEGTGAATVASASVLAADGLGTDVYTRGNPASYTVTAATAPVTPPPSEEEPVAEEPSDDATITFGDPPRAPEAGSTTFLDPELWYSTKTGIFTWTLPFDVTEVALDIATSSDFTPVTRYDPPIEEFTTNDEVLFEGVQYLTLQFKNQVGWGGILHRMLKIDTQPPQPFTINVRAGNSPTSFPMLTFEAKDETSGIERYEMTIADQEMIEVTPDEAKLGYLLNKLEDGTYTVEVVAYDFAGNKMRSTVPVLITAGWLPPSAVIDESSIWDFFKGKNLIIMLLIILFFCQTGYMIYLRKQHDQKEHKLRKETKEIQDQMEKIFSALRDEIYDQINLITKKQRLSKKEREAVEGLNQALEVSETLIEKEISDVNKILK